MPEQTILILNQLFAMSMPFTHIAGYFAGGIAFFLSWKHWKALQKDSVFFWLKIFLIYGIARSLFSADPNTGYSAMLGYLSQWAFPFILGFSLQEERNSKKIFFVYYNTFFTLVCFSILAYFGVITKSIGDFQFAHEGLLKGGRSHIALGALCLLSSFFALGQALFGDVLKHKKLLYALSVLVLLGAIFLTGSRSYYIAAAITYAVFIIVFVAKMKHVSARWIFAALALVIMLVSALYHVSPEIRSRILRTGTSDGSVSERMVLYKVAMAEIRDNPLFGVGPGQAIKQDKYFASLPEEEKIAQAHHTHLHSFYLNFAAEFGFVGILLFAFIVFTWLKGLRSVFHASTGFKQALAFGLFWGFIGILIGDNFDTLLRGPGVAMELFWFAGLVFGINSKYETRNPKQTQNSKSEIQKSIK